MLLVKKIEDEVTLKKAFEIRQKVFVEEQQVDPELEYDEYEEGSTHYLALLDGIPVGTARWRKTEKGIKLERFAVLEEAREKGVGNCLLKQCLADIPKQGIIYLHAQVQVIPFYERSGFVAEGEEFIEADIRHRKMVLKNI
jgi:predicted GNAT family N-acyltransferase